MTYSLIDSGWSGAIKEFTGPNNDYYEQKFVDTFSVTGRRFRPNVSAAIFGPLWAAGRGLYGLFILIGLADLALIIGIVFLGSGGISADHLAKAQSFQKISDTRRAQAEEARRNNNEATATQMQALSDSLAQAAQKERDAQKREGRDGQLLLIAAISTFIVLRLSFAVICDWLYARQFMKWRQHHSTPSGRSYRRAVSCAAVLGFIYLVVFCTGRIPQLSAIMSIQTGASTIAGSTSSALDVFFSQVTQWGRPFFNAITSGVSSVVNVVEGVLRGLPWVCTIVVTVFASWLLAGRGTAIFTAIGLTYLAFFGFWEKSMVTIALLGTAALLALAIGIPLGIICGKSPRTYNFFRPVLDLMQTMPAFIYLVPIIAFFGIGKTPGVLATIIFGMPPVARLTALGLQQIPVSTREAAIAFGATPWQNLIKVELPLAMPSIMAGINQTILMCLSMVVIASLIGAGGLGEDVLQALQYASVGQGFLVGGAVLICAIILDRLIQGKGSK